MKVLWTLVKVALVLVLVIPVAIIVLATVLGVFGALLGLAILTLRLAIVGLIAWGAFRLVSYLVRGSRRPTASEPAAFKAVATLPPRDPHYEAAMRELDRELGGSAT
jgi:hypothetical protein